MGKWILLIMPSGREFSIIWYIGVHSIASGVSTFPADQKHLDYAANKLDPDELFCLLFPLRGWILTVGICICCFKPAKQLCRILSTSSTRSVFEKIIESTTDFVLLLNVGF